MSNLDNKIKDKLEGYRSEVNPNMWTKIEAGLPIAEQTTTRNFFWPVFGFALLTSVAAGYYLLNSSDSILLDSSPTIITKETSKSGNNDKLTDVSLTEINEITDENLMANDQIPESINLNIAKNEDLTSSLNVNSSIENTKTSFDENLTLENQNKQKSQFGDVPKSIQNNKSALGNNLEIETILNKSGSASLYEQYNSILKATKSNQKDNIIIIERELEDLSQLDFTPQILNNEHIDLNLILDGMANKRTICPTFKNVRFGIFAEAFYSNDFGLRDLSYNYLGEGNYLEARNNTESANYSFSAGARVSFIMPNGLGAKTGFTYSQINESFKYLDETHKKTKTIIIKEYIWENNLIVDSIENKEEIEVEGALNVVSQNKYKSLDLPLLITYEWGYKNRLYYAISGGPLFNIKFSQKGKFLNPETLTPIDFSTGEGNYQAFNTNIGTSIYLAFALNYQLGNNADIFIEPNMRHNLKHVTLNSYELNQKYTVFGLGFGIKYKL